MPNRLINESSLYLRQHAENPVDWYPWGEEALNKAKSEDKPILVSIGYSSCHWCHVMAHESFEDAYIARLMNTHFVCIKVDREERPDVDQIYMDAVQMLNGQGGWPLNVFCLPDGRPFAGGTYFPPNDNSGHNLVPWPQLLVRVADFFNRQRGDLEENAQAIMGNLLASNQPRTHTGDAVSKGDLVMAVDRILQTADPENGGFGTAPKFPPSMTLGFLLSMRASSTIDIRLPDRARQIDVVIRTTLSAMAKGGIYDQIGGGFARYSVDQHWRIPHFEKMLYDNALLMDIYSRAWQRYPDELYKDVVEETIAWLEREMAAPSGAYYAALDADTDGHEGITYLWNPGQVESVLGESAAKEFCGAYAITGEGNFENTGLSNPSFTASDLKLRKKLTPARNRLLLERNHRPQPGRDEKCIVAWNGLMVRGLARAAFVFGRQDWMVLAKRVAGWIWTRMRDENNCLASVAYGDRVRGSGNLNDYACSAEGFMALAAVIDWLHPGESTTWLRRAEQLLATIDALFDDPEAPGYFFISSEQQQLVHRKKDWYDGATPAGMSSLIQAHAHLYSLTGNARSAEILGSLEKAYPGILHTSPAAASHALAGLVDRAIGHAVIKIRHGEPTEALRKALVSKPWRQVSVIVARTEAMPAAYQLCVGTECMAPTDDLQELIAFV